MKLWQKIQWGVWIIVNVVAAFYLRTLTFVACWLYYFEERMPPDAGGIHQIYLTKTDVVIAIFIASSCSALFAACAAGLGLYIHQEIWQHSMDKNHSKRWGWWVFLVNWIIIFFPSILMGYKFFVQRSAYF